MGLHLKIHHNKQSYPTVLWANSTHIFWKDYLIENDNVSSGSKNASTSNNSNKGGTTTGTGTGGGTGGGGSGKVMKYDQVICENKLHRNEVKIIVLKHKPWKTDTKYVCTKFITLLYSFLFFCFY